MAVKLRTLFPEQQQIKDHPAKRKIIRAGRRGGKTTLAAHIALCGFLEGHRVLYATPTEDQISKFWFEVKRALQEPLDAGLFYKNETKHIIELPGTERRIRGKTAWDADTMRGDYADLLILDEYQLMKADREDLKTTEAWNKVGAPMLLDNDGDAIFIYTERRGKTGRPARELYKKAVEDTTGRWAAFWFPSFANPTLDETALGEISQDMTHLSYQAEVLAQEVHDDPRALWTREMLERDRVTRHPALDRIVVGVDPPGTAAGAECGIVVAGTARIGDAVHGYMLDDRSLRGSPATWGKAALTAFHLHEADRIIGEVNNGGDMVEHTIQSMDGGRPIAFKAVRATRGKVLRAEPVVALAERGLIHHVGSYDELEDQQCNWVPGDDSPDRLDAFVWAFTELMVGAPPPPASEIVDDVDRAIYKSKRRSAIWQR